MRKHLIIAAVMMASVAACRSSPIEVRTMTAPEARFNMLHSFRVLPAPARRDGQAARGDDDPMINNSIANRMIRERIVKSFQDRGYTYDERNADFGVAFYSSAREKLDVDTWDYGYPFTPSTWYPRPNQVITQYTEGTMIVDVVQLGKRNLLWRGVARGELTGEPEKDVNRLADAAALVIAKFPEATKQIVAQQR